jgi:hypothetical protein
VLHYRLDITIHIACIQQHCCVPLYYKEEEVAEVSESKAQPASSTEKSPKPKPLVEDPDGKLQHYYEAIVEKVPPEVAHIVVWEGAAKNRKIMSTMNDIVDEESNFLVINTEYSN